MRYCNALPNGIGYHCNKKRKTIEIDNDIFSKDIKVIKAPKNGAFVGVKPNEDLKVLQRSLTDKSCPYGEGLPMIELEKGVIALKMGDKFAWLQRPV